MVIASCNFSYNAPRIRLASVRSSLPNYAKSKNCLINNKTQTAVKKILHLHILIKTRRFVCTLDTFSKVTIEI